jgi:cellulose synthase/poly-beta-1,6-N-acetylglucosamine synthase-like glycosyltransferase
MILPQLIFWSSIFLITYTYLLFPAILQLLAAGKKAPPRSDEIPGTPGETPALPLCSVLIAAFNEEEVIEAKIRSVAEADYPTNGLEILVGSDASTDDTNRILERLEKQYKNLRTVKFRERTGKPEVINHLAGMARGEILVITDANVMLERETLKELAASFRDPGTGLVDTRMINTRLKKDGISHQEKFYISREVRIKHNESLLWGTMMGPFGGCYAVRRSNFQPVPGHFLVDDFFINMAVLRQGYRCISNMEARVYEDVSNDLREEFRRKKRISAGNYQNLSRFTALLFSRRKGVAFCFLSHKVLRWIVPFLVIVTLGASGFLGLTRPLYLVLFLLQAAVLLVPIFDLILRKIKIHSIPLRFVSHFVLMNLALLAGFFKYLGGISSNVWQPTKRNQD